MTEINARPAQAQDRDAILAFCRHTFQWGDYIAEVWDQWLNDATGFLIVGEIENQPVGLLHARPIEGNVVWLEGMRVHPDFRRRGVSAAMDATARAWARARGCRFARLATSTRNEIAQKSIAASGYQIVARFSEWTADAKPGELARIATASDRETIFSLWRDFPPRAEGNVLLPNRDWRWTNLTRARVEHALASAQVRATEHGWMFMHDEAGDDWRALIVHALVGEEPALASLASAARAEADYRGFPRVEIMVADTPLLTTALEHAGFVREGGMFICEHILE